MITVCAYWDHKQMDPELEWRMWRQLRGAFGIERFIFTPIMTEMNNVAIDQYDSMSRALMMTDAETPRAFLEPTGYNSMHDLPQGDITLILGNTSNGNMEHARVDETYSIACPVRGNLYGINAAAIALAVRYGQ